MAFGNLGHLTALTRLHTDPFVRVVESAVLPPILARLCVYACESLEPLLPLKSLRQLTLGCGTTNEQLQDMRRSVPEVDIRLGKGGTHYQHSDCHCSPAEATQG
jgi:hypothetical protein